ncbi:MAG: hypothetical protein LUE08_07350 [Akkermansiaceae bacterium]|nr:hypothetical protein [Akkermansiaceae bacterium]
MQGRISFNGGEQDEDMGARVDVEAYNRGCKVLENWDVSPRGAIKRRKGMRLFAELEDGEENARLFPYIYTYSGISGRYLVIISENMLRVLDPSANEEARFTDCTFDMDSCRARQINALMMITCATSPPMQLRLEDDGTWTLEEYELEPPPWRYEQEERDWNIKVTASYSGTSSETVYTVDFGEVDDDAETVLDAGDVLRASFWVQQAEAFDTMDNLTSGVEERSSETPEATSKGTVICHPYEMTIKYYVCTKTWLYDDVYCKGLEMPENYPDNFEESEDVSSYDSVGIYWSVAKVTGADIDRNTKFGIRMGYWKYYTCIKDFTEDDLVDGATTYDDYPEYFRAGIAVGDALPCRGEWEFWCSGTWYGAYAVMRNYETTDLYDDGWETAGISISSNASAENEQITGDESDEECYLRLFLLRSRRLSETGITAGFPSDSCGNRLIVQGYRHDMMLKLAVVKDSSGEITSYEWICEDEIKIDWQGVKTISNWSWQAFSYRYGYPRLCEVFNQRLVFAATTSQPQTIWFSRTDDLSNFSVYDGDDSAIVAELATTTQNPICWLQSQTARLCLGTSEGEFIINAASQASFTPDNIVVAEHGHVGSDENLSLVAADKVLYIERGGGRCYDYGYNYEIDGYRSTDLTAFVPSVLADHGGAVDAALVRKPDTAALFPCADGQMALCTYIPSQQVNAWHRWITDGDILRACVLPNGTQSDRIFLIVRRTINSEDVYAIEVVDDDSTYVDRGSRDYVSTMVTNSTFSAMEAAVQKHMSPIVAYLFGTTIKNNYMQVSSDGGESWTKAARTLDSFPKGWHRLITLKNWEFDDKIGFRVWGNYEAMLIALQG